MARGMIEHTKVNYSPPSPRTQTHRKKHEHKRARVETHEHFAHLKFEAKKEYSTRMFFIM
jgi:hypothetical protein